MIPGVNKKIFLRSIDEPDLELFRVWRNSPDIKRFTREYRDISQDMQEEWYNKIKHDQSQINFAILSEEKTLIGHCGLFRINLINRNAEFSIYIGNKDFLKRGHASDALKTLVNYGFNTLNLHKIWGEVYARNLEALKSFYKVGFNIEGTLKENVYRDGEYLDSHIIGIFKRDWPKIC